MHSFTGAPDGRFPEARIMRDGSGDLWGTTYAGGGKCNCGIIYELQPAGSSSYIASVVYTFGAAGTGSHPAARLYLAKSGTFYGSTELGGYWNAGTLFQLAPLQSGGYSLSQLHEFTGSGDGAQPEAPVIGNASGQIYGTTTAGGTESCVCGTVFQFTPGQGYSLLYSFAGGSDGSTPSSPLTQDSSGVLYGTTESGGLVNAYCSAGCGSVFEVTLSKHGYQKKTLYHFQGSADGAAPTGGLLMDKSGVLYGTTQSGGNMCKGTGCGTVFALTPKGEGYAESVIYSFAARGDGAQPVGDLVEDSQGVSLRCDFEIARFELVQLRHRVRPNQRKSGLPGVDPARVRRRPSDGSTPTAGLVLDQPDGILYGTTNAGGTAQYGTVFQIAL